MNKTIIALCTPRGTGALALLRISGPDARKIVSKIAQFSSKKSIHEIASHTVQYGFIIDSEKNILDHVLFIIMDAPRTFTGENTVEITCHNNPFIIDAILNQAIIQGARVAEPGEFSKRAFLNNKIDLAQAEAIKELIHANTQHALKKSLGQLAGSFSHYIQQLEHELLRALAWCEASFEFLDDESEFGTQIQLALEKILAQVCQLKKTFDVQQQIRQGIRIALIGSVNAGKSSIFNALLNQKRSIVTNIAGTTRDAIEAGLYRNNNYWTLIDTAGLRQTDDIIEQEGIRRSFEEAQKADIVLLIFDGSRAFTHEEEIVYQDIIDKYKQKLIIVRNKSDLPAHANHILGINSPLILPYSAKGFVGSETQVLRSPMGEAGSLFPRDTRDKPVSVEAQARRSLDVDGDQAGKISQSAFTSTDQDSCAQLEKLIEHKIANLFSEIESPFLLNQRQFNLLLALEKKLTDILSQFTSKIQYELLSYQLQEALQIMSELTGKSVSEAGLDMVFKEFCVGK